MKQLDIDKLEQSVDSFERTVKALKEIQSINTELSASSKVIQDSILKIQEEETRQRELSESLDENIARFEQKNDENTGIIKEVIQNQTQDLSKMMEDAYAEVNKGLGRIASLYNDMLKQMQDFSDSTTRKMSAQQDMLSEKTDKISSKVEQYTGSTLKSIDELRIQNSDNARETRDKIVEVDTRNRTEMEQRFKKVDALNDEIVRLKSQIKKQNTWTVLSTLFALAAAAAASSPYWLKFLG